MSVAKSVRCYGLCLIVFFVIPAYSFNQNEPFDVEADTLTYHHQSREIEAEGRVRVTQSSSVLTADYLRYDRLRGRFLGRGNVILREKSSLFAGEEMNYDLLLEKGEMLGGKGMGAPWLFQGVSWQKEQDLLVGHDAAFTSCSLPDAHYHFLSDRISLIQDHLFWAWGNLLHFDKTPVFYSPFLHKSLEPKRLVLQATPGTDSVKGAFAKTRTTYRMTDQVYTRVLYDYYTKSGSGVGNELFYQRPGHYLGSVFGYFIDPKGTPELVGAPKAPQYNVRFYHWQRLSKTWSLQSNTNLRKNVSFNNQFFPQDYNQSVNDLLNSIALTHQRQSFSQRLVVEALNGPDSGADPFFADVHPQTASLPRYEFTVYQRPLWSPEISTGTYKLQHIGPLVFTMNGSAGNTYTRSTKRTVTNVANAFTLSQNINISRKLSIAPGFTPSIVWKDKFDSSDAGVPSSFRGFQGRFGTTTPLRYRPFSGLTLDNTYSWVGRFQPNSLRLDDRQNDGGIDTHQLLWQLYWRPSRTTQIRSFSSYDLRALENETLENFRQRRVAPWTSELTYYPRNEPWEFFGRYSLGYYPTQTMQWDVSFKTRMKYNTTYETGLLYSRGIPGLLTWNNQVGISLSPGWRVSTILNTYMPSGFGHRRAVSRLLQSEFVVTRNLHCWEVEFRYRNRQPFSREYAFRINLRFGTEAQRDLADPELESQFYPWRYKN